MYESLKEWIRFPFTFRRIEGKTASGDKKFSDPISSVCYRVDEFETITKKTGETYVSYSKLYVPGNIEITTDDKVTLMTFGSKLVDKEIQKIQGYFDGNEGKQSVQVIYL